MAVYQWRWVRRTPQDVWHRVYGGMAPPCGADVGYQARGGRLGAPPVSDPVCERCAKLTRFRRRVKRTTKTVRVDLPAKDVRDVVAAGLDPAALLREGWRMVVDARRPLTPVRRGPGRDVERLVYDAGVALLEEWQGKGVPIRELRRRTRLSRGAIHDALGGPPRPMYFGAAGTHRAYPAERIHGIGGGA